MVAIRGCWEMERREELSETGVRNKRNYCERPADCWAAWRTPSRARSPWCPGGDRTHRGLAQVSPRGRGTAAEGSQGTDPGGAMLGERESSYVER